MTSVLELLKLVRYMWIAQKPKVDHCIESINQFVSNIPNVLVANFEEILNVFGFLRFRA